MNLDIDVPKKLLPIFETDKRFIVLHGGRGSGKSHTIATYLVLQSLQEKCIILCTREIQNSIKDSVHKLLVSKIDEYNLKHLFNITDKSITNVQGSEFIFKGLYRNTTNIKSTEGIRYCWIEEAQTVSRKSLTDLVPTVRIPESKIIFTYNPTNEDDPVHTDYTMSDRNDVLAIDINYEDNPWFSDELRSEMEYCKRVDYDAYLHIWQGQPVQHSEDQVFYGKWEIKDFEESEQEFLYGADWGFSQDPTVLVRSFVKDNCLYIDHEVWAIGCDIIDTPDLFDKVPGSRQWPIIADSARPETISHMKKQGFNIKGAKKGKGSVEDGIQKLRGFEKIYIHPRCKKTIDEFRLYCWKKNKLTDEIMPIPEDKHNHIIDALRYATEKLTNYANILRW